MFIFRSLCVHHLIMAFVSSPSSHVPGTNVSSATSDGPPAWFAKNSRPMIDWDQAKTIRRVGLTSLPSSIRPHPDVPTFPRWPCFLCHVKLKTAQGVHRHVEMAHGQCHDFFRRTTEFFTRCTICCEFFHEYYCICFPI